MTCATGSDWVIYSPNESAASDGAGFWSSEHGWVELGQATRFTAREACDVPLPMAVGHDARFVPWHEVVQHYG